ncbi:MAG: MOSC domain-containing protein YiiM [Cyclobacteriaceae bacterium]|jgi:MOSC domain-containing protein YiiM
MRMAGEVTMKDLLRTIPQIGEVVAMTIRPERKMDPIYVEKVEAVAGSGLSGDHFAAKSIKREVTLIQAEHLNVVEELLSREVPLHMTRRNIMVKGINLLALKGQQFTIGDAVFEGTGECYPCSRMEANFGPGGYNAMRGHGGLTAKIIQSGTIKPGDKVALI